MMWSIHGPTAVGVRYGHLFSNVKGENADVKHRLYGENFVVDDKIWTARVVGDFMGIPGHGRRISIRILHVSSSATGSSHARTYGSTPARQSRN